MLLHMQDNCCAMLIASLQIYYSLNPSAKRGRCPTSLFVHAAQQAFSGSGEIEDGSITIEDIIVVIASLVDQVSSCVSSPLGNSQGMALILRVSFLDIYHIHNYISS